MVIRQQANFQRVCMNMHRSFCKRRHIDRRSGNLNVHHFETKLRPQSWTLVKSPWFHQSSWLGPKFCFFRNPVFSTWHLEFWFSSDAPRTKVVRVIKPRRMVPVSSSSDPWFRSWMHGVHFFESNFRIIDRRAGHKYWKQIYLQILFEQILFVQIKYLFAWARVVFEQTKYNFASIWYLQIIFQNIRICSNQTKYQIYLQISNIFANIFGNISRKSPKLSFFACV